MPVQGLRPGMEDAEGAAGEPDGGVEPPEALVGAATAALLEAIAQARHPLAAELTLCEAVGAAAAGLPRDVDEQQRRDALALMLGQVIAQVETLPSVESLALLRVCSVLGPTPSRRAAGDGADRMAAAGVAERPWAGSVGSPQFLRAWHSGDVFGAQSSIGVLFDYRGREHAVMILLDHDLGGGVKDCWVAEGRVARGMRNRAAAALAGEPDVFFEDVDAQAVAALLGAALACSPCPEQPDQVEDVNAYLYLVQARVEHLDRLTGRAPIIPG